MLKCLSVVIDLHAHIIPQLDDGVRSLEEARELARAAVAEGITAIAATPHVREDYPTTPERMEAGVAALRADFAARRIALDVLHGGEIALDLLPGLSADDLRRFTIAQTGRYLLLEFPYYGWPLALEHLVLELRASGITAILAHPERNPDVQRGPDRLRAAVDEGALVQLTAASIDGRLGRATKRTAMALLELDLAHLVASDAHSPDVRAVGLAAAARTAGDGTRGRRLVEEVPAAIVSGEPLPRGALGNTRNLRE